MKKENHPEAETILRQKAEALMKRKTSQKSPHLSEFEAMRLVHELEVHQIELELQNEELFLAKEKAAEMATEKYAELYDFAPSAYFTLSRSGDILELNLCGAQMLGKERSLLKRRRFSFFISDDSKPLFNNFLAAVFKSNTRETCEITICADGNKPIYTDLVGIASENGDQCLVTLVDITEHKQAEEVINRKNEELQKINAEKDKFFSIIAHDLRSPFNGFLGLTEIMAEGLPNMTLDEIQQIAMAMRNSAANLFHLLGNLLEWSRMQRGLTTFLPASVSLISKINENMVLTLEEANKKEITINYNVPDELEVFADSEMLGGIIRNLMTNAVKFTPRGGSIFVSAKAVSDDSVQISIQDKGIGMNRNMIDNLFHLDVNTNRKGTEGESSTGLGLIICKDFIEKNSGKLWIESEEGKGSRFSFTLPARG